MAVDMFLKIEGVDGESSDHKHKGEIDIFSFSWGVSNTTSQSGGGGGAGKATVHDFSFVKTLDKSSPVLFEKCCSGQHISEAWFTMASPTVKGEKQDFYKIRFQDILVSSVEPGGS